MDSWRDDKPGIRRLLTPQDIRAALKTLFETQALVVEPSSAITVAFLQAHAGPLDHRHDGEVQEQAGKGEEHIDQAHDGLVDDTAEVVRRAPENVT